MRRFAVQVLLLTGCDVNVRHLALVYPDTGAWVGERVTLATNLDTFAVIRVEGISGAEHTYSQPEELVIVFDDPSAIEIEDLGPVGFDFTGDVVDPSSEARHGTLLRLRPLTDGQNRLRFLAEQTDEAAMLAVTAESAERVRFERAWRATEELDARLATFGRRVDVTPTFYRGASVLTAWGPLELASVEPESAIVGPPLAPPWLKLADARHTVVVTAPGVSGSLSVAASTADDIAAIGVEVDSTELIGSSVTLAVGERVVFSFSPLTASGLTIDGLAPELQATLDGSSAALTPRSVDSLWIDGIAPGGSTLSLVWGAALRNIVVEVP